MLKMFSYKDLYSYKNLLNDIRAFWFECISFGLTADICLIEDQT